MSLKTKVTVTLAALPRWMTYLQGHICRLVNLTLDTIYYKTKYIPSGKNKVKPVYLQIIKQGLPKTSPSGTYKVKGTIPYYFPVIKCNSTRTSSKILNDQRFLCVNQGN